MGSRIPHPHSPHNNKLVLFDLETFNRNGKFPGR